MQTDFWFKILSILGISAVISAIVQKIVNIYLPISWLTFISAVIGGGLAYCLILWILGFVTDEEKLLIKNILKR